MNTSIKDVEHESVLSEYDRRKGMDILQKSIDSLKATVEEIKELLIGSISKERKGLKTEMIECKDSLSEIKKSVEERKLLCDARHDPDKLMIKKQESEKIRIAHSSIVIAITAVVTSIFMSAITLVFK